MSEPAVPYFLNGPVRTTGGYAVMIHRTSGGNWVKTVYGRGCKEAWNIARREVAAMVKRGSDE